MNTNGHTNGKTTNGIVVSNQWVYQKDDLHNIYRKVKAESAELLAVVNLSLDSLIDKEDGSNGLEDSGISRGGSGTERANTAVYIRSTQRIAALRRVIEAIQDGQYTGICRKCGETIALARLYIVPESNCCQHCARK
ncbi:MAG: hypothetical protein WCO55_00205 [Candidatus Falkowbacteria bacterium]